LGFPVFPTEWHDPKTGEIYYGYRESGYLPDAFINILAHLGWNPGTEQELFSMTELTEQFSLERVGKHGSKFDPEKARWFNHQYLHMRPATELADLMKPVLESHGLHPDAGFLETVITLTRDRAFLVPDLWNNSWFFFLRPAEYDQQVFQKIWHPGTSSSVQSFAVEVAKMDQFDKDKLHELVQEFTTRTGIKMGHLMNPLRLLTVGSNQGPGMMDVAEVLGKEEFLERIRIGLEQLR
jgi:glutamyl-tRNA synthetase